MWLSPCIALVNTDYTVQVNRVNLVWNRNESTLKLHWIRERAQHRGIEIEREPAEEEKNGTHKLKRHRNENRTVRAVISLANKFREHMGERVLPLQPLLGYSERDCMRGARYEQIMWTGQFTCNSQLCHFSIRNISKHVIIILVEWWPMLNQRERGSEIRTKEWKSTKIQTFVHLNGFIYPLHKSKDEETEWQTSETESARDK